MQRLCNFFLGLFLVTATLALVLQLAPEPALAGMHTLTERLTLLLALPVMVGLGLYPSLRKRIFVPLLIFLFWSLLDFWPLEPLLGNHYRLLASAGQLIIALLALSSIRRQNSTSLLLYPEQVGGPDFSWGRLLRISLLLIPLLSLFLLLLGYAGLRTLIESRVAGFIRLKPNGLYLVEKVYTRGDKEIRLVGMIHMGQQKYYEKLADTFKVNQTLVLAEGVSDNQELLKTKLNYGKVAGLLGLSTQQQLRFPGRLITAESLDQPLTIGSEVPDILCADIDLQEFDPRTIAYLNAIPTTLFNNSSLKAGMREFMQWSQKNATEEGNRIFMDDVLIKRNQAVLSYLPKGLQKYRSVLIPWGAMHMPGIEVAVKEQGFSLSETREWLSIDFFALPFAKLWE